MPLVASLALLPLVVVAVWIWGGYSRPSIMLVFEGYQMVVLAPAWLILVGALVASEWVLAGVAAFVAGSHLAFCLPAATADPVPDWVRSAATLTVFAANVRYDSDRTDDVAALVAGIDADIVVLNEMTPVQHDALEAAGVLARFGTEVYSPGHPFGELMLTRLPASDRCVEALGGARVPAATVQVAGRPVRAFAVHVHAPKASSHRHLWRRALDALGSRIESGDSMPYLMAGDFNSAPWHGPYRWLLGRGLRDAHDALGKGLSRSWIPPGPVLDRFGPIMRIDHALFTDGLFPRSIEEVDVPGSDHIGFRVEFAVR